jgi:hypothetical protein
MKRQVNIIGSLAEPPVFPAAIPDVTHDPTVNGVSLTLTLRFSKIKLLLQSGSPSTLAGNWLPRAMTPETFPSLTLPPLNGDDVCAMRPTLLSGLLLWVIRGECREAGRELSGIIRIWMVWHRQYYGMVRQYGNSRLTFDVHVHYL